MEIDSRLKRQVEVALLQRAKMGSSGLAASEEDKHCPLKKIAVVWIKLVKGLRGLGQIHQLSTETALPDGLPIHRQNSRKYLQN